MTRLTHSNCTILFDGASPLRGAIVTGVSNTGLFDTTARNASEYFLAALNSTLAAQVVAGTAPFQFISATIVEQTQFALFNGITISDVPGLVDDLILPTGIFLSTGERDPAMNNASSGATLTTAGLSDADMLDAVAGAFPGVSDSTNDAASLSVTILVTDPSARTISSYLVFGSEEFAEYSNNFVDGAVFIVDGVNYGLFAGPTTPLSVTNTNLVAGDFYNNTGSTCSSAGSALPGAQMVLPLEYDGVSQILRITAPLGTETPFPTTAGVSGTLPTIKIAVADTNDEILDSGMWIGGIEVGGDPGFGVVIDFGNSGAPKRFFTTPDVLTPGNVAANSFIAEFSSSIYSIWLANANGNQQISDAEGDMGSWIYGYGGDDTQQGNTGYDVLNGGIGLDTAVFVGPRSRYVVTYDFASNRLIVVYTLADGDGSDIVAADVERLVFEGNSFTAGSFGPSLSIAGPASAIAKGQSGSTPISFTVSRSGPTNGVSTAASP